MTFSTSTPRKAGLLVLAALFLVFTFITACEEEDPVESFSANITISAGSTTLAEDVGNVTITLALSQENTTSASITASYSIAGTATNGSDYSGLNGTISIPNGSRNATATLAITDDDELEGDETIILSLDESSLPDGINLGNNTELTLTIQDNDVISVSVTASDDEAAEGDNEGAFTINLSSANSTGEAVTINYTLEGTATNGEDYTSLSGQVDIADDATSATIPVEIIDDETIEGSETVILKLSSDGLPDGFELGTPEATITIEDNDEEIFTAEVSMNSPDPEASEEGDNALFRIRLSETNSSGEAIEIGYEIGGTATNGEDYTSLSGSVSIADGEINAPIEIEVIDDEAVEGDETVTLTISSANLPDGITLGDNSEGTATITDNDEMTFEAVASLTVEASEADEGGSTLFTFSLDKTNDSGAAIGLQYSISGTATNGDDYATLSGSISIEDGESTAELSVTFTDDNDVEESETLILTLDADGQPDGISLADNSSATVTINDNDEAFSSTASITATDAEASEDGDNGTFLIALDKTNDSGETIDLEYQISGTATSGTDYTSLTGSVSIANGESSVEVTLEAIDDDEVEDTETVTLSFSTDNLPDGISVTDNGISATANIIDNDEEYAAEVSISSEDNTATEGGDDASFTISLSNENTTGEVLTVPYTLSGTAENGSDYASLSGSAEIANGSSSVTVSVDITDDSEVEEDETVIVTLNTENLPSSLTAGSPTSMTLTITDNDIEFSAEASVAATTATGGEGSSGLAFTFSLSQTNTSGADLTIPYTVSGSATSGSDYDALSGSVVITENSSDISITVAITDDSEAELDETLIITLGTLPDGVTNSGNDEATGTIEDNEPIEITFGTNSGNSISITGWTSVSGADGYVVIMNSSNNFTDPTSGSYSPASTSYRGYDQQVIYDGTSTGSLDLSLLASGQSYYFKVYPYTGSRVYVTDYTEDSSESTACTVTSTSENEVCWSISGDERNITSNQYPDHETGSFPNADVTATALDLTVDLTPALTDDITYVYNETGPPTPSNKNFYTFGVASNGLGFNPMGLKPFSVVDSDNNETGEENWEWQAKVTDEGDTHLDEFGAHVTSQGKYHYHGDANALASDEDGNKHSLIYGFAADGFPIYYKYGFSTDNDFTSNIKELKSSYQLRSGSRPGDGLTAPDGDYDGTYIQDFEFVSGLGDLDECNGRYGVTPEFPDGTYYYVITGDFPKVPNCFKGTPSTEFIIGN